LNKNRSVSLLASPLHVIYSSCMERSVASMMMNALAQPTRLATFALLARSGQEGMLAGEVADAVGVQKSLMSAHFAVLSKAGLIEQTRSGRNVAYRALPARVAQLTAFLVEVAMGSERPDGVVRTE
jgi:ArsR family transcriptional regulator